jgi:streptomycin 3"-adenylyltransferase
MLAEQCGGELRAAYLHGSAALGGWIASRSDVDLLFVAADGISPAAVAAAGDLLVATGADCPGVGLEASLVTVSQASRPAVPWPFLMHIGTGAVGEHLTHGAQIEGDADLLMHYAVCRAAGIALLGPPPADVIGPVGRHLILAYLADELGWGLANASESYAVLNACRALAFCLDGQIMSKVAGGEAALRRGLGPAVLVRDALRVQTGQVASWRPRPQAIAFVQNVIGQLRVKAAGERRRLG